MRPLSVGESGGVARGGGKDPPLSSAPPFPLEVYFFLGFEPRFQSLRHLLQHESLHAHHGPAVVRGDHLGQLHRLCPQLCAGNQVVQQPDPVGFLRLHDTGGEQQLLRDRPTDLIGQRPGAVDPAIGRGQKAELALLAAHPHIEGRGEHRGAAIGEAVHHADRRLRARTDLVAAPSDRASHRAGPPNTARRPTTAP